MGRGKGGKRMHGKGVAETVKVGASRSLRLAQPRNPVHSSSLSTLLSCLFLAAKVGKESVLPFFPLFAYRTHSKKKGEKIRISAQTLPPLPNEKEKNEIKRRKEKEQKHTLSQKKTCGSLENFVSRFFWSSAKGRQAPNK